MSSKPKPASGPFRADQLRCGDPYELSNGHAIRVSPGGGRHAGSSANASVVLRTDPAVTEAGLDVGYSPEPGTLRAPDIAVGNVPNAPGWVKGAPPLAVEYADTGQDEEDLQRKIDELFAAGTKYLWVVRLTGARRVEVYEQGRPMYVALPGQQLHASGVLRNPVRVEELYDPEASLDAALRNLLQRRGVESLEAVEAAGETRGEAKGRAQAVLDILVARKIDVSAETAQRIRSCTDRERLSQWIARAITVQRAEDLFDQP